MKRLNKIIYSFAAMGLALGAMTSCDDDKVVDYVPATPETGGAAYFSTNVKTNYELAADGTTFNIQVMRTDDEGSVTVPITVTASQDNTTSSAFSFPSSVSFADGENTANIVVTYNVGDLEFDDSQSFTISIDESFTTQYGSKSLTISVVYPSPWDILGEAMYFDAVVYGNNVYYPTELSRNALDPTLYRLENPYYPVNEEETYFTFQLVEKGGTYNCLFLNNVYELPVTSDNFVGYEGYYIFTDESPDTGQPIDFYLTMPALLGLTNDYNYVAEYQDNGLPGLIILSALHYNPSEGYWYGDNSKAGLVRIVFPGFDPQDTSLSVEYVGLLTNGNNSNVIADVAIGSDLTSVKLGIGGGTNVDAISEALQDGTLNSIDITTSGEYKLPFSTQNESGKYTIVAIGYVDDEVRTTASATFTHTKPGTDSIEDGWTTLGYIDYRESYMCALFSFNVGYTPDITYPVLIQESDEWEGYYRLVNPYGEPYPYNGPDDYIQGVNSFLYIDTWNPDCVFIEMSPQTLDWGYGELTCYSLAGYILDGGGSEEDVYDEDANGTLVDGVITFPPLTLLSALGEDGWYYGNAVTAGQNNWVKNPDGTIYAPFYLDLNAISSTPAGNASLKKAAERAEKARSGELTARRVPGYVKNGDVSANFSLNRINGKRNAVKVNSNETFTGKGKLPMTKVNSSVISKVGR